ncbi:NAD-dependent epimerase/dehydratase family protein [Agathobaculum sp. Marseille-P7918]|uniref:NAD-dependent epimerase/dehydratase family protein n=1 Tax=Agathobaculum sp. Marseille-P7918 TaxID=2479843 RepID=UPI003569619A
MTRIAVIGANGYLARNFTFLCKNKANIRLYAYGYEDRQLDGYENYTPIDVFSKEDMRNVASSCDVIYFFTGKTGTLQGFEQHDEFLNLNIRALVNTLNAAKECNPFVKIVFPSTRLVYKGAEHRLTEDAEKQFLTPYALQKFMCEQYLEMYKNLYGIRYSVARICVPYGSHIGEVSAYGTIGFFIHQLRETGSIKLFGDGHQTRTFTYIDDLCNDLLFLGINEACDNQVYNIGGENLSLKDLAGLIVNRFGGRVEYIEWPEYALKIESGDTMFDSSKLDLLTGLSERTRINEWLQSI